MEDLIEVKRLTVINIVDNETDALSSPCSCMAPIPNKSRSSPDERPCKYTQEFAAVLSHHKALDFDYVCHAAHGLSLLIIAEYDDKQKIIDDNGDVQVQIQNKSSHLLFDGGPDKNIWRSNAEKLKVDLPSIETVVLSHYHILVDHFNGLRAAVEDISHAREYKIATVISILNLWWWIYTTRKVLLVASR